MAVKRVYKPEEKLKIVLEGMIGTISLTDLCRKYDRNQQDSTTGRISS